MKMIDLKTADLDGAALDYMVGVAQGWTCYWDDSVEQGGVWHLDAEKTPFGKVMHRSVYHPSTDPAEGQPILERLVQGCDLYFHQRGQVVICGQRFGAEHLEWPGATMLIAGLRCFVAHRLGDVVKVPAALVGDAT